MLRALTAPTMPHMVGCLSLCEVEDEAKRTQGLMTHVVKKYLFPEIKLHNDKRTQ